MTWKGNSNLSKLFIPFIFLWGLLFGEILPVCIENNLNCFPNTTAPGGKESMFSSLSMFIPTIVVYSILATLFWFLYKKLNWKIVAIIAIVLGQAMEFFLFKPQEGNGVNVVTNPTGSFLFFLIIWPILLVLPYFIFHLFYKRISR
ncbi:hypothetical protein HYZ05_00005 [Candidatus Daviesbacteria bacterium]|nr:hypothetical protein [Candidatus Daviesbacteria bacterium]